MLESSSFEDPDEPGGDVLSIGEISAGISALSQADRLRLRKAARFLSAINGLGDDVELLQEALVRAFEGRRKCRRDLPIVIFIVGAMRSIANAASKSARRSPVDRFVSVTEDFDDAADSTPHAEGVDYVTPEREEVARNLLQKIQEMFKDDEESQMMLYAIGEGFKGEGLREELGLTDREENTIRTRISRKLDEWLAEEWRAK